MTGGLSPAHWAIVILVVLLLFGSKKLPDTARSLGRSMRILKAELDPSRDGTPPGNAPEAAPRAVPEHEAGQEHATGGGRELGHGRETRRTG